MRCTSCKRNVAAGVEAQKMIVEYKQADGSSRLFGYMMSDGPLSSATGQMVRGWHHLCYWVAKKREARGDAVSGRVVTGTPTGYEIGQLVLSRDDLTSLGLTPQQARERSTVQLSAQVQHLREIAESIGKGVGDPQVQEAFAAAEHGGPYPHHHGHRLDTYQLVAHLRYAHAMAGEELTHSKNELHDQHLLLHAQAAQAAVSPGRDPAETRFTDWREQQSFTIE